MVDTLGILRQAQLDGGSIWLSLQIMEMILVLKY
jgi:hypothetical protein